MQQLLSLYTKQSNEAEQSAAQLRKKLAEAAKDLTIEGVDGIMLQKLNVLISESEKLSTEIKKKAKETKLVVDDLDKIIGEKG